MLSDLELQSNLAYHQQVYAGCNYDLRITQLSSKSSILEVCGWVEQAMDLLVRDAVNRCKLSPKYSSHVDKKYIEKTFGFEYRKHFEKMLIAVVGYRILEKAEVLAGNDLIKMESILTDLSKLRNHYAHTHFDINDPNPQGYSSIPTPTIMVSHAKIAASGLLALEASLIQLSC
jgi:hypothetical protein